MKKNNKIMIALVLIIAIVMSIAACGKKDEAKESQTSPASQPNPTSESGKTEDTKADPGKTEDTKADSGKTQSAKKVAYLTPSMDVPFWRYMAHGIEVKGKELNIEIQVFDSKDSADTQMKNAQDVVVKQFDGIIISPVDSATCPAVLSLAEDNKIPVAICDIGTDSGEYVSFISTDNEKGARVAGEYLAGLLNKGDEVAQITLNQARINGRLRKQGFEEAITAAGMKQVDFRQMEKVNRQEGETFAQDLITAYPNLKGIFAHSEDPSMGALNAIEAANKLNDVKIISFDCSPEIIEAIKAKKITATSAQQPIFMGATALEQLDKHFKGEPTEKEIKMDTLFVTSENIDSLADELYEKVLTKN